MSDLEVLVVGGGHSGASVAYHLAREGMHPMVMEAGKIALGCDDMLNGTCRPLMPAHSKMILSWAEARGFQYVRDVLGDDGLQQYLALARDGVTLQKNIARALRPECVRSLGTVVTTDEEGWEELVDDVALYRRVGEARDVSAGELSKMFDAPFPGGFYLPHDAIIDPFAYVTELLSNDAITVVEDVRVSSVDDLGDKVRVETRNRGTVDADYVVLATNGLFGVPALDNRWTFTLSFADEGENTPNVVSHEDDTYDIVRQDGYVQFGYGQFPVGRLRAPEDEPGLTQRVVEKAYEVLPRLAGRRPESVHFGIVSYTKDGLPMMGKLSDRVVYVGGCNACSQGPLSYLASLVPGVLGVKGLSGEEKKRVGLLSPSRSSLR